MSVPTGSCVRFSRLPVVVSRRGQGVNLLELHRLELARIQAQSLQDGRSDLLVAGRGRNRCGIHTRDRDQQRGVNVVLVESTVLGDLGPTREDDSGLYLQNDVRS